MERDGIYGIYQEKRYGKNVQFYHSNPRSYNIHSYICITLSFHHQSYQTEERPSSRMVLLTQTPAIITALETYASQTPLSTLQATDNEPSLTTPTLGAPISHSQILQLFHTLKSTSPHSHPHLPSLLRSSTLYIPPPAPKPQPSSEYTALMARLRAEQENKDYEKMLTPATAPSGGKNPYTRFAAPKTAAAWDLGVADVKAGDEDTGAMAEIDAQISLIVNVVVSIVACGGGFFPAAEVYGVE